MHLITLLGQTSSGKTQLSLDIAQYYKSKSIPVVIVGCDSRQIYKHLNLGTGKIQGSWQPLNHITAHKNNIQKPATTEITTNTVSYHAFYYHDIPHFLIDYVEPTIRYSLNHYLEDWCHLFKKELAGFEGIVILVGGTGLWAQAITHEYQLGTIQPDYLKAYTELSAELNTLSLAQLQEKLIPYKDSFNQSDWSNPRRLINSYTRRYSHAQGWSTSLVYPSFDSITHYAIQIPIDTLRDAITLRLDQRINEGLIDEVESLLYLDYRLLELGLEYRLTYYYLLGHMTYDQWYSRLLTANIQYAKRQYTWLKKHNFQWGASTEIYHLITHQFPSI